MFEIRKDLPIPENISARAGARLYPFADMVVGDSFVVKKGQLEDEPEVVARKVKNSAREYGRKNGCSFHVALNEQTGDVTCWMIEKKASQSEA
jgi:hypothetical protein